MVRSCPSFHQPLFLLACSLQLLKSITLTLQVFLSLLLFFKSGYDAFSSCSLRFGMFAWCRTEVLQRFGIWLQKPSLNSSCFLCVLFQLCVAVRNKRLFHSPLTNLSALGIGLWAERKTASCSSYIFYPFYPFLPLISSHLQLSWNQQDFLPWGP